MPMEICHIPIQQPVPKQQALRYTTKIRTNIVRFLNLQSLPILFHPERIPYQNIVLIAVLPVHAVLPLQECLGD